VKILKTSEKCKHCGEHLIAEFVDIGIGWDQVTEGVCPNNCDYIEWEYQQYKDKNVKPLDMDEWLKLHAK
jgi:hypothetical protein